MASTTEGSASVDTSPRLSCWSAAIFLRIRRMIFPDRVLGRPGTICGWKHDMTYTSLQTPATVPPSHPSCCTAENLTQHNSTRLFLIGGICSVAILIFEVCVTGIALYTNYSQVGLRLQYFHGLWVGLIINHAHSFLSMQWLAGDDGSEVVCYLHAYQKAL